MHAWAGARWWCALVLLVLCACDDTESPGPAYDPLVAFDTIDVAILAGADTTRITAELADNGARRAYGLMERADLPESHGMLFVYPTTQPPTGGFWMYLTLVPLDIAFLDADGTIVAILAMDPCRSPNPDLCRGYSPGVPYRGALEVRQGFLERHGIATGDRVVPAPRDVPATQ